MIRTGSPGHLEAARRGLAWSSATPAGSKATSEGGYQTTPKVVRPSSDTKSRSPVEAKSARASRAPTRRPPAKARASSSRTPGESTVVPSGSSTTGTSGP